MATIVRCNCGAEYKRTETKFLVPHTGDAVCGAALESWWTSTHIPKGPGQTDLTVLTAACRVSWIPSAAAVRAGDDFKQVAVRVFEVDTASAVVVIDLT
jgi:hypothetical protein